MNQCTTKKNYVSDTTFQLHITGLIVHEQARRLNFYECELMKRFENNKIRNKYLSKPVWNADVKGSILKYKSYRKEKKCRWRM